MVQSRLRGAIAAVAVVVGCLLSAAPCRAQEVAGQAGPFATPISARSVEVFASVLGLDAEQKAVAKALYSGYRSDFRRAADKGDNAMRVEGDKLREDGAVVDHEQYGKKRMSIMREFVTEIERLEKAYMADLKAILTPEQAARFERAECARRREVGVKFSLVAGEGVDLFAILRDNKIDRDSTPEVKDILDPYEVEVDRTLVGKTALLRGVLDEMEKFEGPNADPAQIEKIMEDFFRSGMRLRDVHRSCARRLIPLLPAEKQDAVDRAVKLASFPRVYKESAADKTLAAALAMKDLTPEQKSELESIRESYHRELDGVNARWASAIEAKQSDLPGKFMTMGFGGQEEKPDDPLHMARAARIGLDDRTIQRISQLLSASQRESLPQIEKDTSWHGHEYMPDFDERENWDEWIKEDEN